jgi:AcrR family transcriptional regulator
VARSKPIFIGDPITRKNILDSARTEVDLYGIIGLRLSSVAEKAQVSIPLIYKYFEDRDGLLAVVLGDWYEEFTNKFRGKIDSWLDAADSVTLDDFAHFTQKPRAGSMQKDRDFRLKVLATSLENPQLRLRIKNITNDLYIWGESAIDRLIPKLPSEDRNFDRRIFTLLMFNIMYVFHDMLDQEPVSDSEHSDFLVQLIRASSKANSMTG